MASRPKTLIASVAPLLVAAQNFFKDHVFNQTSFFILLGCFLFMSLLQISTNLANDYFDFKKVQMITVKMHLNAMSHLGKLKKNKYLVLSAAC